MTTIDKTPLIVLTNRRYDYIPDALQSLAEYRGTNWVPPVHVIDDSGDADFRAKFVTATANKDVTFHIVDDQPAGYTAAMRKVWEVARELNDRVFLLEEDFVFVAPFDIADLHGVLDTNKNLAQAALLRKPWYANEKAKGVMPAQRDRVDAALVKKKAGRPDLLGARSHTIWADHDYPVRYHSHDAGFTGNPSLIASWVFDFDWPEGQWTEEKMGDQLIDAGKRFAWVPAKGTRNGAVTEHVGADRAETSGGY